MDLLNGKGEYWLSFEKGEKTGKVRATLNAVGKLEKGGVFAAFRVERGILRELTFFTPRKIKEIEKRRRGILLNLDDRQ